MIGKIAEGSGGKGAHCELQVESMCLQHIEIYLPAYQESCACSHCNLNGCCSSSPLTKC